MSTRTLVGSEGELVSISIEVQPQLLEKLLDTLAELSFPINPEIHHADSATVVDFPAYAGRLDQIRAELTSRGFDSASVRSTNMLDQIRSH